MDSSILKHFKVLPDPRKRDHNQTKHQLLDIIVITILGVLCGADTWGEIEAFGHEKEEWLKQFLALPNGIPSHDTFNRVFSILDPEAFEGCFFRWVESVRVTTKGEVVAIDGKTVRRAHGKDEKPIHIISQWHSGQRWVGSVVERGMHHGYANGQWENGDLDPVLHLKSETECT